MPPITSPDEASDLEILRTRLRAEEKKLALVQEIGQALSSALDLDRLLALIMEKITILMEADRSTLYLFSDDGTQLWSKMVQGDRKSTRLNSSHSQISYAVFCLKKKKKKN